MDIAAIGLGQAGGNLAAEFFRRGYRALALNTAETDLAALEPGGVVPTIPPERRLYIGLDGYDGAGADPGYGRDCIRAHADRIRSQAQRLGQDADAVVLCAGLGGGTGSAVATLIEVLEEEDLPLIGLMTLPTEAESGLAKVNAVRTINEVVDAGLLGWVFIDNGRLASLNLDVSVTEYYGAVNGQIVEPLDALNRLNSRDNIRPIRSFDGEDFRKLLLAGGVLNYATTEIQDLTVDEIVGAVKKKVQSSDLMPSGFDIERVSYLGLIIEAPTTALANTPIAVFEQFHDSLKKATGGAAIYQGTYRTDDDQAPILLRMLGVTQSLPYRIRSLLGDAKREGQVIGSKIQEDLPGLELGEIQDFDLFRTRARPSERPRRARAANRRGARPVGDGSDDLEVGRGRGGLGADMPPEIGGGRRPPRPRLSEASVVEPRPPIGVRPNVPPPEALTEAAAFPIAEEPPRIGRRRRPGAGRGPRPVVVESAKPEPPDPQPPAEHPDRPSLGVDDAGPSEVADWSERPKAEPAFLTAAPSPEPEPAAPQASIPQTSDLDVRLDDEATVGLDLAAELASVGDVRMTGEEDDLQATVAGLRRPPPADPDADTGDLPSPKIYKELVQEFQSTDDEDMRLAMQQRLEADSVSDNSVVRYYAVEAMAKLGRDIFGRALLAATDDEDEAVRNLAVQAFQN